MEFSGQYLTYDEYKALGGTIDQTPFNLLEFEIRNIIDRETLGRLINQEKQPIEVKTCIFKLIEGTYYDGNYKDVNTSEKENYIQKIIFDFLTNVIVDNVPILYRGV